MGFVLAIVMAALPQALVHVWQVKAAPPPSTTVSRWSFAVYPDGRYDFSIGSHTLVFDEGAATVDGSTLTLTERDVTGARCRGKARVATYRFRTSGTTLTLTPVQEPCAWRKAILAAGPLSY
jgi:hypothetical protein